METKLYIRDGKRFKYVPNMLGMYWNGTILTKENMQDSIAIIIEQHYDHVTMASLKVSVPMNWFDAKEWCLHTFNDVYQGRLPLNTELITLHKYVDDTHIWGEEYSAGDAWYLNWDAGNVYTSSKNESRYVKTMAVADIPILNLI